MKSQLSIYNIVDESPISYPFKSLIFPGGEPHVEVNPDFFNKQNIWIDARITDSDGFISLLLLVDAVKACNPNRLGLFIPYFPGARQDRRENGTANSIKIYGEIIKNLNLDFILTLDPHSDVIDSILNIKKLITIGHITENNRICPVRNHYNGFICPDSGAIKRVYKIAKMCGVENLIYGNKHRDVVSGKLSGFSIDKESIEGKYLIIDDICDGGGTFVGLADKIKETSPNCILHLAVSHGIFSKYLTHLLGRFDLIKTTDSFPHNIRNDRLFIYNLWWEIAHIMKGGLS